MKTPLPSIDETPEELKRLLMVESDVPKHQRLQALYRFQTQQARTRRHVACLLGVSRNTVGRWLAAYESGGVTRMITLAKPPGKVPHVPHTVHEALRQRLAQPEGLASDKASWPWLQQEYGLQLADNTVHRLVRYKWRAKLKAPRKSPRKKP
jgi:putative transposase